MAGADRALRRDADDPLDITIVNVALPSIQRDLGFSQSNLAGVVNAYMIPVEGLLLLLAGRVGDLVGRKQVFLAGPADLPPVSYKGGRRRDPSRAPISTVPEAASGRPSPMIVVWAGKQLLRQMQTSAHFDDFCHCSAALSAEHDDGCRSLADPAAPTGTTNITANR